MILYIKETVMRVRKNLKYLYNLEFAFKGPEYTRKSFFDASLADFLKY